MNELSGLKESLLFGWALLPPGEYAGRLAALWAVALAFPSLPIAAATFRPLEQPLELALAGSAAATCVVLAAALRLYLGWSYVGDRLLSASIEYEESGW